MSHETFRVGECAQLRTGIAPKVAQSLHKYMGEILVIEGPLRFVEGFLNPMYLVRCLADHELFYATPWSLKKLPPPAPSTDMLDTAEPLKVVRWAESPWRPKDLKVKVTP